MFSSVLYMPSNIWNTLKYSTLHYNNNNIIVLHIYIALFFETILCHPCVLGYKSISLVLTDPIDFVEPNPVSLTHHLLVRTPSQRGVVHKRVPPITKTGSIQEFTLHKMVINVSVVERAVPVLWPPLVASLLTWGCSGSVNNMLSRSIMPSLIILMTWEITPLLIWCLGEPAQNIRTIIPVSFSYITIPMNIVRKHFLQNLLKFWSKCIVSFVMYLYFSSV